MQEGVQYCAQEKKENKDLWRRMGSSSSEELFRNNFRHVFRSQTPPVAASDNSCQNYFESCVQAFDVGSNKHFKNKA